MAAILLALFISLLPLPLQKCAQLPGSMSPDGKYLVVYQPPSYFRTARAFTVLDCPLGGWFGGKRSACPESRRNTGSH
jgi:hypothetical protein